VELLRKLFSNHAMKQSESSDFLPEGVGRKKVFRHISQEINDFWDMCSERLAIVGTSIGGRSGCQCAIAQADERLPTREV